MVDITLQFYNGEAAKLDGVPLGFTGWLIKQRSWPYIHVEYQFSQRYGGISFSCTLRDGAKCCRFKMIDYSRHKKRWEGLTIEMTDAQEDLAWAEACVMAGMHPGWHLHDGFTRLYHQSNECYYNPDEAIKYDVLGQGCHISLTLKWWKPDPERTFCSPACARLIWKIKGAAVYIPLYVRRDEVRPQEMYDILTRKVEK